MDTMNNKTDRYFRERLGNFEQSPPPAAWDQIALRMKNNRKKRTILILFRIAAGMAILISTGIGIYLLTRNNPASENTPASYSQEQGSITKEPIAREPKSAGMEILNNSDIQANHSKFEDNNSNITSSGIPQETRNTTTPENINIADNSLSLPLMSTGNRSRQNINLEQLAIVEQGIIPDTLMSDLQVPDHIGDTGITANEAEAILLAMNEDNNRDENVKKHKWSIGSEIAPLYSYRNIDSEDFSQESILGSGETGILAYSGGFRVAVAAGKRLSVQSGVYYSRYGQEINQVVPIQTNNNSPKSYRFIAASNSTGTISGVVSSQSFYSLDATDVISKNNYQNGIEVSNVNPVAPADAEDISLRQLFEYFELPLIVKYKIIDRKIDFSLSGGMVTNFLIGNAVNMINDGESKRIAETSDIREINYLGSVGMGIEYPLADKFSLTLEPRFRYYINPINTGSDFSVHPYSFGFFAGINYRF